MALKVSGIRLTLPWLIALLVCAVLAKIGFDTILRNHRKLWNIEMTKTNGKQIVIDLHLYADDHEGQLPPSISTMIDDNRYGLNTDTAMGSVAIHDSKLLQPSIKWTALKPEKPLVSVIVRRYPDDTVLVYPDMRTETLGAKIHP